jgi:predicted helicase
MLEDFKAFFNQIKYLDVKEATEHTLRPALDQLLKALADKKIKIIHEPKRDPAGRGAPDFKFKLYESILGYIENKKTGENLDQILQSEQIARYKQLSGNLILTNYLEWIWLKDGVIAKRETLCYPSDIGYYKARIDPDKAAKVEALIAAFLSTPPKGIGKAQDLALALAIRCHELREFLTEELLRQEQEHQEGRLFGLFEAFKRDVFHELDIAAFANAFAQMLGYGLFLARLNNGHGAPISLNNAKQFIPTNFELIKELVDFLDELDKEEYRQIRWVIEEILSIMNNLDLAALQEDLAFSKRQGRLFPQTEEERLLFAKDPYVYFYEDFLKAYDKDMRKSRGIYYTPPPVVNFIIRAVNDILKTTFDIKDGLADRKRVTVLDFATGTGTFLLEVIQQILEVVPEGLRDQVISEHVLRNLYGFEYLIAPYTIAHLKLSQFLQDQKYMMKPKERLQIYLTNTLEPIEPQKNWLLPALSKEVELAQNVKDTPILVITGNPPYKGHSLNPSYREIKYETKTGKIRKKKIPTFIGGLIESYKKIDGQPLREKNLKWLHDDYVKFIRFSQWKMDQVEEGIVGIITNHSFLDNPTFRGMRQSLMQTFNQIYVLDLHGSTKKKEKAPEGGKDENVFDIEQGVCISLLVRKPKLEKKIFHADFWGKRREKYRACAETDFDDGIWNEIHPEKPFYLFIEQHFKLGKDVDKGWRIIDIMPEYSLGNLTKRDMLAIAFSKGELKKKISSFTDPSKSDQQVSQEFDLPFIDKDKWDLVSARKTIINTLLINEYYKEENFRPFEKRRIFYHNKIVARLNYRIFRQLDNKDNPALVTVRQLASLPFCHVFITSLLCDQHYISTRTKEGGVVFPLYLYNFPQEKKSKLGLFEEDDPFKGQDRIENFATEFRDFIDQKYDHHYEPEEILGYIYAVLHSPTYRQKYAEFLKIDFPRIPFVDERQTFEVLSRLGWALIQAHLLKEIPDFPQVEVTPGSHLVDKPLYHPKERRLYINPQQYFAPVPEDIWNFHIGGYQVLDKYLKSRKDRHLSLDELENVINVVKVLRFTIDQMQKIDQTWQP